jgi:hypothetical protein
MEGWVASTMWGTFDEGWLFPVDTAEQVPLTYKLEVGKKSNFQNIVFLGILDDGQIPEIQ